MKNVCAKCEYSCKSIEDRIVPGTGEYQSFNGFMTRYLCKREVMNEVDPVTGKVIDDEYGYLDCTTERSQTDSREDCCGRSGKFFKKRKTIFDWIKGLFEGGNVITQTVKCLSGPWQFLYCVARE